MLPPVTLCPSLHTPGFAKEAGFLRNMATGAGNWLRRLGGAPAAVNNVAHMANPWASAFAGGAHAAPALASAGMWSGLKGNLLSGGIGAGLGALGGYGKGDYDGAVQGTTETLKGVQDFTQQHPWQTAGFGLANLVGAGPTLMNNGLQSYLQSMPQNSLNDTLHHSVLQSALNNLMPQSK